jgi:hypothetical protein
LWDWRSAHVDIRAARATADQEANVVSGLSGWARIVTVGTIIAFFVVAFLGLVLSRAVSTNPGPQRSDQCELLATVADPQATVLEPQNTWSNFGYLVAGLFILYRSRTLLGAAVGLNLAFEFLLSSLYHAKLTDAMQYADVAWIYVLLLSLIAYAIQSLLFSQWAVETGYPAFSAPVLIAAGIAVITVIIGVVMGLHKNDIFDSTWMTLVLAFLLFVLLGAGLVAAGIRCAGAMSIVMPIVLVISVGIPTLFFKFSDGTSHHLFNWCCPKAVLQSHSAWHIVSAVLILVAYDFFANFAGDGRIFSFAKPAQEFTITSESV